MRPGRTLRRLAMQALLRLPVLHASHGSKSQVQQGEEFEIILFGGKEIRKAELFLKYELGTYCSEYRLQYHRSHIEYN